MFHEYLASTNIKINFKISIQLKCFSESKSLAILLIL